MTGSILPTLAPATCVHTAPGTHAQLSAVGLWNRGRWLLMCRKLKLTKINHNLLSKSLPEVESLIRH